MTSEQGAWPAGDTDVADVAIVGAGVVGTAIARTLAQYDVSCVLIDAAGDVGTGTTKANTAILHTGFDAPPGSLEARLLRRGRALLHDYAGRAGIPLERTGALLIAWNAAEQAELPGIEDKARRNGYPAIRPVSAEELYRREPHLGPGAVAALEIPDESIICPWTTPLAYATEAVRAGVRLLLGHRVTGVSTVDGEHRLSVSGSVGSGGRGGPGGSPAPPPVRCRWVVNAAGLHSDTIDAMFGGGGFSIRPRRGELIVLDKLARPLLSSILLPVPTARTKGVLVAPTVYGNVLIGPTADDVEDRSDVATTAAGLSAVLAAGTRILPALAAEEVTATYAGLRAATEHRDYQIEVDAARRYARVAGIRSTGLSASLGIAEYVVGELGQAGPGAEGTGRGRSAGHAVHRGGGPASLSGCGPDRGRSRLRPDRLPLRAGHPRRDPGRAGQPGSARGPVRPGPPDPGHERPLPGLLLRRDGVPPVAAHTGRDAHERRRPDRRGRAGLAAAVELRRLGIGRVLVADREETPGGVPRHCAHTGFGLRDLRRVMTGPGYARHYAEAAADAGADIRTGTTVTGWAAAHGHDDQRPRGRDGQRGGGAAGHRLPGTAPRGPAGARRPPARRDDHR